MTKKKNIAINQFNAQKETEQTIDKKAAPFVNMSPYWYILMNPFQYFVQLDDDLLYYSIIDPNIIDLKSIFAAYKCKNKESKLIQIETTLSSLLTEYLKKLKAEQHDIYANLKISIVQQIPLNYKLPIYEDKNIPKQSDPNYYTPDDMLKRLAYYESDTERKYVITGFEDNYFNRIKISFNYQGILPTDSHFFNLYYYCPPEINFMEKNFKYNCYKIDLRDHELNNTDYSFCLDYLDSMSDTDYSYILLKMVFWGLESINNEDKKPPSENPSGEKEIAVKLLNKNDEIYSDPDMVSSFYKNCCKFTIKEKISTNELFNAYKIYVSKTFHKEISDSKKNPFSLHSQIT